MSQRKLAIVTGASQVAASGVMTDAATAVLHRKMAEPGSGKD